MKKIQFLFLATIACLFIIGLNSCTAPDETPPFIYILGTEGRIVGDHDNPYDTTVLLFSQYIEPRRVVGDMEWVGVQVEDNATRAENIIVSSDKDDIRLALGKYLRRVGQETITYTAIDEEGNERTAERNLNIRNISSPFEGRYSTNRLTSDVLDDIPEYNSNIRPDAGVPGRLVFSRVYYHEDDDGNQIFYRVSGDLWSEHLSNEEHEHIAFMGRSTSENDIPFFDGMSHEEAFDTIQTFTRINIPSQIYTDTLNNQVRIQGRTDEGVPRSVIEYVPGTRAVQRITLVFNVTTVQDGLDTGAPDRVTEVYVPN